METNCQLQLKGFYYCMNFSELGFSCEKQCSTCKAKEKVDTAIFDNYIKSLKDAKGKNMA